MPHDFKYEAYRMHLLNERKDPFGSEKLQAFQMEKDGSCKRWSSKHFTESFSSEFLHKGSYILRQLI